MNEIIASGKDTEEAINNGLKELGCNREDCNIEILETSSKGFLGIFGQKDAKVKLTLLSDPTAVLTSFLTTLLAKMGLNATVNAKLSENNRIYVDIAGENMGIIIGRRGETLDALQHVAQLYINKSSETFYKVTLDTEDYRAKREEALKNLAGGLAKKVLRTRKDVVLEPMKPYERRIIHTALQGYSKIKTHSIGEEPNRKIVVSFKYPKNDDAE